MLRKDMNDYEMLQSSIGQGRVQMTPIHLNMITAAIANALTAYAKTADVTKAINAAVAGLIQLDDLSVASTGAGNVVTGLAYDNKTGKFTVTKGLTALTEADFTEITQQEVKAMFA